MLKKKRKPSSQQYAAAPKYAKLAVLAGVTMGCSIGQAAYAMELDAGNPDAKLRWDNTVKYSAAFRTDPRSERILADARTDDGNQNFNRGLVSNRVDLLSELDGSYKNLGFRVSGAAWYDTIYNRTNDNSSPLTSNNISVPFNEFTRETRERMGRKAELLDAFVYAKGSVAGKAGTVRFGRHSLVFGETLFFGANGIAAAQGPIDLVKLLSVPSTEFKEVLRPVNQISGQLQVTPKMSVSSYYQLEWERSILPPVGSYLSTSDITGEGTESAGPFLRAEDQRARNRGQGGLQMRYRLTDLDAEIGVYAARYHEKSPNVYLTLNPATFAPANLVHTYAEDIRTYGVSLSTVAGSVNVAGEVSVRDNVPLVSDPQVVVAGSADNRTRPAYAVGRTLHANASAVYLLETGTFWEGGALLGEIALNRRLSIDQNPGALDPNTTRSAGAIRILFSPAYYQVLPGLDVSVPIGIGYNLFGKSSAVFAFNGGVEHGGDFSIGVTGTYENAWQFSLNYVRYLGREDSFLTPPNSPTATLSYAQALKDRNFVSLSVKRSF